jgi:plasmid maintenance system antidote protein VapI|tara:strand:+ start:1264 stop:1542 length:279 start_codon:yes stop_codon:yes gene_type:complete
MATEIGKETKVKLSLETIISLGVVLVMGTGMWFTLQADIAEAKELPAPIPPEVTRMEFQMKDEMIRNTIMNTQEDVTEIKKTLEKIEDKLYK